MSYISSFTKAGQPKLVPAVRSVDMIQVAMPLIFFHAVLQHCAVQADPFIQLVWHITPAQDISQLTGYSGHHGQTWPGGAKKDKAAHVHATQMVALSAEQTHSPELAQRDFSVIKCIIASSRPLLAG